MSTKRRGAIKRTSSSLVGLEALKSFKVPKKQNTQPLLEDVNLNSIDYLEDILPQVTQSFRFPQLIGHFQVDKAWLIHNRTLEDRFSAARKRCQKNPVSNTISTTDSSLCTGFLVVKSWSEVQQIANDGLRSGNDPNTWLGQPHLGLTVNQCADLAIAHAQERLNSQILSSISSSSPNLFMIIVRWVKSRAYIVSSETRKSEDRLEPQPGYACHVSTWSRLDLLDPNKLSLEQAFQLSQIYLFEFDDDMDLRPKPEHVIPFAVLKCSWNLTSDIASKLDPISVASGSILILPTKAIVNSTTIFPSSRAGLLPTPPTPPISKRALRKQSRNSYKYNLSRRLSDKDHSLAYNHTSSLKSPPRRSSSVLVKSHPNNLTSPPLIRGSSDDYNHTHNTTTNINDNNSNFFMINEPSPCSPSENGVNDHINSLQFQSRRLQTSTESVNRYGNQIKVINESNNSLSFTSPIDTECFSTLIGISMLTWGYPQVDYSLNVDVYTYRKGFITLYDGILQPCLHIERLVSLTSIHYELAGLKPWLSKPMNSNGPPILVSIPYNQEWNLPRLNVNTASSLNSDPSPFGGYCANYFRLQLHESNNSKRTEMAQFCQALIDNALAGIISIPCDDSSIMFVFPDCQLSKSIGLPPGNDLDRHFLHLILFTPFSLNHYLDCNQVRCKYIDNDGDVDNNNNTNKTNKNSKGINSADHNEATFIIPPTISASISSELLIFGQKKTGSSCLLDNKFKLPLDRILSSLPDSGKYLLGNALISALANRSDNHDDDISHTNINNTSTNNCNNNEIKNSISNESFNFNETLPNLRSDPRLRNRYRDPNPVIMNNNNDNKDNSKQPDWYALASALISSAYNKDNNINNVEKLQTGSNLFSINPSNSENLSTKSEHNTNIEVQSSVNYDVKNQFIPEPSSPVNHFDIGVNDDIDNINTNINSVINIPTEIPLDNNSTNNPLSSSSPVVKNHCEPYSPAILIQSNSIDMEVETENNNTTNMNQSDMEIDTSLLQCDNDNSNSNNNNHNNNNNINNNNNNNSVNNSPLKIKFRIPPPPPLSTPTPKYDSSVSTSQLSVLISNCRRISSRSPTSIDSKSISTVLNNKRKNKSSSSSKQISSKSNNNSDKRNSYRSSTKYDRYSRTPPRSSKSYKNKPNAYSKASTSNYDENIYSSKRNHSSSSSPSRTSRHYSSSSHQTKYNPRYNHKLEDLANSSSRQKSSSNRSTPSSRSHGRYNHNSNRHDRHHQNNRSPTNDRNYHHRKYPSKHCPTSKNSLNSSSLKSYSKSSTQNITSTSTTNLITICSTRKNMNTTCNNDSNTNRFSEHDNSEPIWSTKNRTSSAHNVYIPTSVSNTVTTIIDDNHKATDSNRTISKFGDAANINSCSQQFNSVNLHFQSITTTIHNNNDNDNRPVDEGEEGEVLDDDDDDVGGIGIGSSEYDSHNDDIKTKINKNVSLNYSTDTSLDIIDEWHSNNNNNSNHDNSFPFPNTARHKDNDCNSDNKDTNSNCYMHRNRRQQEFTRLTNLTTVSNNHSSGSNSSTASFGSKSKKNRIIVNNHKADTDDNCSHADLSYQYLQVNSTINHSVKNIDYKQEAIGSNMNYQSNEYQQQQAYKPESEISEYNETKPKEEGEDEEEYKLIDEVHTSIEISDSSFFDNDISIEDEDMRTMNINSNKYSRSIYHTDINNNNNSTNSRRSIIDYQNSISLNQSLDSYTSSTEEDELSLYNCGRKTYDMNNDSNNNNNYDVDYRHDCVNLIDENKNFHNECRPSLLGNYSDSSTSMFNNNMDSNSKYSFYCPRQKQIQDQSSYNQYHYESSLINNSIHLSQNTRSSSIHSRENDHYRHIRRDSSSHPNPQQCSTNHLRNIPLLQTPTVTTSGTYNNNDSVPLPISFLSNQSSSIPTNSQPLRMTNWSNQFNYSSHIHPPRSWPY